MAKKQQSPTGPIYQIKISLKDARPPIWRRVLVPADYSLAQLHAVIQTAMGWTNSHLHQFIMRKGDKIGYASDPRFDLNEDRIVDPSVLKDLFQARGFDPDLLTDLELYGPQVADENKITLGKAISAVKGRIGYEYDFGDSWDHDIVLEKTLAPEAGVTYPVCTGGKRACPPDDSGGVWGYMHMLDARKHPDDPENREILSWLGEDFDPEAFDQALVNPKFKDMDWILNWD